MQNDSQHKPTQDEVACWYLARLSGCYATCASKQQIVPCQVHTVCAFVRTSSFGNMLESKSGRKNGVEGEMNPRWRFSRAKRIWKIRNA
jgi:hypothetical protein